MELREQFRLPPRTHTDAGAPRRVGVEVEFANLSVDAAAALVARLYGGSVERASRYAITVRDTRLGDFEVETDASPLKAQRYRAFMDWLGVGAEAQERVEDVVEAVASTVVPSEIVAPPVPLHQLPELERLRRALLEEHAEGTRSALRYAFGFQLNPELPGKDAKTLLTYLRAFVLLYDWLVEAAEVDVSRRLAPWIEPFPQAYVDGILADGYAPELDALISDYLAHNPTRNRPLDLLPAFAELRPELVQRGAQEPALVKARPTFHYRLPNSQIDEPDWSFAREWNRWVEVERLAEDPPRLEALRRTYLERGRIGDNGHAAWAAEVTRWIDPQVADR